MATRFPDKCIDSLRGLVKMALMSRRPDLPHREAGGTLIILANGPSLTQTINENLAILQRFDTLAVNFAANTPVFTSVRPRFYVLADPHFFSSKDDENLRRLWNNLRSADWGMTLAVPCKFRSKACDRLGSDANTAIATFNDVGVEGFSTICRAAYSHKLSMPRPRNVLIPSLMIGIWLKYKKIYITGADHSWMRTLSVDDNNEVVSIQEHFYSENGSEQQRVRHEYRGYRLHQIVESMAVAFKSYHQIARFAAHAGTRIINATPGSFIDAFERGNLPD